MSKTWIYHKDEQPMLVEEHQAEEYYKHGWADTPAAFLHEGSKKEAVKQENSGVTKKPENHHIDQKGEAHGKNHPSNEHEPQGVERQANEPEGKREKTRQK